MIKNIKQEVAHELLMSKLTLSQLKKPMEVGRCACITAQLKLEDCSPQGCQILAATQEKLTWTLTPENFPAPSVDPLPHSDMNLCELSQSH